MAREIAAVEKLSVTESVQKIEVNLAKSPRRVAKAAAEAETANDEDGKQEEAAA